MLKYLEHNHWQTSVSQWQWMLFLSAVLLVYILGLWIPVMEVDAAELACISSEMLRTNSFLQVFDRGENYLDKPPLLFWLSSLSIHLFGITHWAYKLPSVLSSLLGLWATYHLAKVLYNSRVASYSIIILLTSQAYILMNQDIRADTLLTNFVIASLWQFYLYFFVQKRWRHLIIGSLFLGLAMLAKGPIALGIIVLALSGQIAYQKAWRVLCDSRLVLGFIVVFIVLLPMNIGLYQQFEWEGFYFYYWLQSFGRVTGQSSWRNNTTIVYFLHTFLWLFFPWMGLGIFAIAKKIKCLWNSIKKGVSQGEYLTLSGALLPFIALSLSKYKLPHYIFALFPLFAILTAAFIDQYCSAKPSHRWSFLQANFLILSIILLGLLSFYSFPIENLSFVLLGFALSACGIWVLFTKRNDWQSVIWAVAIGHLGINTVLNGNFYPQLLKYQVGHTVRTLLQHSEVPIRKSEMYFLDKHFYSAEFAANRTIENLIWTAEDSITFQTPAIIIAGESGKRQLEKRHPADKIIVQNTFPITRLKLPFLIPEKRQALCEKIYFLWYLE